MTVQPKTRTRARPLSGSSPPTPEVDAPEDASKTHRRRQKRIDGKRGVVLDAALRLFSRLGHQGTTLEQIANDADLSKTNVLYYFRNKDEIYRAVIQGVIGRWLEPLGELRAGVEPEAAITRYVRSKLEFSRDHPEASRLFCTEIVRGAPLIQAELSAGLKTAVDEKAKLLSRWKRSGKIAAVDPRHLIFSIWAVTQHYADFAVQVEALTGRTLQDPAFFEDTVAAVTRIILSGVLPGATEPRNAVPRPES